MASQRKSHVFRVTGLLRHQPDEDPKKELQKVLEEHFTDDETSRISPEIAIVPSCYDYENEYAALVQFRGGVPQFLSESKTNPLGEWQVEAGDTDLNFDCHFFGFTQLYTSDEDKPVIADIIAICDLDGHAYGSWQGRGNLGRMWLRDFLSKDLSQCRTMIYGYNSKLSDRGVEGILDYGRQLMEEIKQVRNTKELQQRPLIFVAHSFGGIILAHCLVRAIQAIDGDHPAVTSLHRATYGMLLFAIPHKGLVVNDIQQMLAGDKSHPRTQLLQQISEKSDLLTHQLADFKNLIRDRKVVSFYGTAQTRQLVLESESGRWTRAGDFITTVDAESAVLQLPDHVEDKISVHADHSMIVKFDAPSAPGYRAAREKLKQFVRDAPQVVTARFAQARHGPRPCSTVPFKRDLKFIGREDILEQIKERYQAIGQQHERLALVGLAGAGKTQVAIEYSYRVRESTPGTWVFWIHASSAARVEQSYQQIATVAEIPGRDSQQTNIFQLVYQWLNDERNGHWLIVLDNADDDDLFFNEEVEKAPLVNFLPQAATHGFVLITSRNRDAARNLVCEGLVIDIQPMNEDESLALLRAKNPNGQSVIEDEKALVQALDYLPLAITHAGSHIASRSPRITVSRYLELFRESESNQIHLLMEKELKDYRRDSSNKYTIITTWQLSFNQIRQTKPSATDLLSLMSMFDRQGIPEFLVRQDLDTLQFEDSLASLISYSLIQTEMVEQAFNMQRLVQLSVRTWLDVHHELARWQRKSRAILAQKLPNGDYETWSQCRLLLAHAKEVMKHPLINHDEDLLNAAMISNHCGWYLTLKGAPYEEGEVMLRRALEARDMVLGPKHPKSIDVMIQLGHALYMQSKHEEAEEVLLLSLMRCLEPPRSENSLVLRNTYALAVVFHNLGRFEEAEMMYRRVLEGLTTIFGPQHVDTLAVVAAYIGIVVSSQGNHKDTEAITRQVLEGYEKLLGPEHPRRCICLTQLGNLLHSQGEYKKAEQILRHALEKQEKVLGRDHHITLDTLNFLGAACERQGRHEEAEELYRKALEGKETILGSDHFSTINGGTLLERLLHAQGRYEEAKVMHERIEEAKARNQRVLEAKGRRPLPKTHIWLT